MFRYNKVRSEVSSYYCPTCLKRIEVDRSKTPFLPSPTCSFKCYGPYIDKISKLDRRAPDLRIYNLMEAQNKVLEIKEKKVKEKSYV